MAMWLRVIESTEKASTKAQVCYVYPEISRQGASLLSN